jgi:hypothetical protein
MLSLCESRPSNLSFFLYNMYGVYESLLKNDPLTLTLTLTLTPFALVRSLYLNRVLWRIFRTT